MDETSLKLYIPPRPGLVVEPSPKRRRRLLQEGGCGPDLKTKRAAVTLVAFACDDEETMQTLPQVFIVNEHVVTKDVVEGLGGRCLGNVRVLRRKSSCVSAVLTVEPVQMLASCLQDHLKTPQGVFYMDTCPAHLHPTFFKACSDAGMHLQVIPASATAWLQPLDVSVFGKFKSWVVREVERQRLGSSSGMLSRAEMLEVYRMAVDEVIRGQGWARAFELCGLKGQGQVSTRLLTRLSAGVPPAMGPDIPALEDHQNVFPQDMLSPIAATFRLDKASVEAHRNAPVAFECEVAQRSRMALKACVRGSIQPFDGLFMEHSLQLLENICRRAWVANTQLGGSESLAVTSSFWALSGHTPIKLRPGGRGGGNLSPPPPFSSQSLHFFRCMAMV